MMRNAAVLVIPVVLAVCDIAAAQPAEPAPAEATAGDLTYAFGARVGGYGFRNTEHADVGQWDDCRMEGMGVFAQRSLTRHFFAEAGFDLYTAKDATPTPEMPLPGMDRISGITTVAAGARIPWRWVSPYVQLGVGLEVTRVEMADHGMAERAVLPMGFLGLGADVHATTHLSVGANVRSNVMKHFDHGAHADADGHDDGDMHGEYEAAAQGQIFLKYEL